MQRLVLLAVLLTGCPTPPAPRIGPDGATMFVEVGTGETSFAPLADGDALELVYGPQGGYHVWGACGIYGIDPEGRVLHYTLRDATTGEVLADLSLALATRRLSATDGGWLRIGDRVIFPGVTEPSGLTGRDAVLSIALEESRLGASDAGAAAGDAGPSRPTLARAERAVHLVDALP